MNNISSDSELGLISKKDSSKNKIEIKIYVLKLEHNCFYIGMTLRKNINKRFQEHFEGKGSEWTKLHKPLEILEIYYHSDEWDENKITKKYMDLYGIDKVRGGSYCNINLSNLEKQFLLKEQLFSKKCFKCNNNDHFTLNCPIQLKSQLNKRLHSDLQREIKANHKLGIQNAIEERNRQKKIKMIDK